MAAAEKLSSLVGVRPVLSRSFHSPDRPSTGAPREPAFSLACGRGAASARRLSTMRIGSSGLPCYEERFQDCSPAQATLRCSTMARYYCSIRTMYRLRKEKIVNAAIS